jgi:tRNA(His) 5'-end guanylyltransferase
MIDSLGSRIKRYEKVYDQSLTPRSCLFIRVDGKAFHSYAKKAERPFDWDIVQAMALAAQETAEHMQGFKAAYIQSDECTFLLTDFDNLETQGWFDYRLNKVLSITASMFTAYFNQAIHGTQFYKKNNPDPALFDARAFIVPREEAPNVFIWRQRDWERNSVQMVARSLYSHKECNNKKITELHDMIFAKGKNWAKLDAILKNGTFLFNYEEIISNHHKFSYAGLDHQLLMTGLII